MNKVPAQLLKILCALPQRRHSNGDHIEPVVEVLAETPLRHLLL